MCIYSSWSPLGMRSVVSLFPSGLKPLIVLITSESKGLAWFTLGVKSSSTIHRDPEYQSLFSSSYTSSLCVSSPSSPGKRFLSSLLGLIHPCLLFIYLVTGFFFFFFSSTSLFLPTHLPPPSCTHTQSCNPMDCSPPGFSVHGLFQARILEWVAISFSIVTGFKKLFIWLHHVLVAACRIFSCGMWDLSSLTRGQTQAVCMGSVES